MLQISSAAQNLIQKMQQQQALSTKTPKFTYLNQEQAQNVDKLLMDTNKAKGGLCFTLQQLMEMAGMSCAHAVHDFYHNQATRNELNEIVKSKFDFNHENKEILLVCGPGNNGGDSLVCARHLKLFGFEPKVWFPTMNKTCERNEFMRFLVTQLEACDVPVFENLESNIAGKYSCVIDGLFGFSFSVPKESIAKKEYFKSPFDTVIKRIREMENETIIASIDIPSGWDVEKGNIYLDGNEKAVGIEPHVLISLTAPKLCAQFFKGIHYLGGRFIPPKMAEELQIPPYENVSIIQKL